jgi:hypothetical protein
MWKKISFAVALGLALYPQAAMAEFDPFAGIVEGIAQGLAVSGDKLSIDSSYADSGVFGGNVVIGNTFSSSPELHQKVSADTGIELSTSAGTGIRQGVNVFRGEVPVMMVQGTSVTGAVAITSSNSADVVQGINLVTACGTNCE